MQNLHGLQQERIEGVSDDEVASRKEELAQSRAEVLEFFSEITTAAKDLRSAASTAKSIAESQVRQAQSHQKQAEKARMKVAQRMQKENKLDARGTAVLPMQKRIFKRSLTSSLSSSKVLRLTTSPGFSSRL